jgi:hypothetical protein
VYLRGVTTISPGAALRTADSVDELDAARLERLAAQKLADALAQVTTLHEPGQRDRYRELLESAIEHANRALAAASASADGAENGLVRARDDMAAIVGAARSTLVKANAAKAEDALHGAGQLSLSAQRAPTLEACDDGWRRVEAIVLGAELSARIAAMTALELERDAPGSSAARSASTAARVAEAAALASRRIIDARNHAYTFHADRAFSFGEGWYLAAAGVLAGVAIQVEPEKDGTLQAEQFLHDAGLSTKLQPYRSRPRAMKHTTEIVGRVFRADPRSAQSRLRAAFLGEEPIPGSIVDWVERKLVEADARRFAGSKVLVWIRDGVHHPDRNTRFDELVELTSCVKRAGLVPVLTGDAIREGRIPDGVLDLILFWKDPIFQRADMRRAQLQFFELLKARHGLVGQLGVTTAGMDGPALMGLPTLYLTDAPNVRMREWVSAVPGYQEVIRESGYLARVSSVLAAWAGGV